MAEKEGLLLKLDRKELKSCGLCEDNYQPIIVLPPKIFAEIEAISRAWDEEWLAYLKGTIDQKNLIAFIQSIVVPKQEVSSASVDVHAKDVPADADIIGTVHSHHTMGSFFSGTDTGSIAQHHPVCLVYSHKDGIKGLLQVSLPCGNYILAPALVEFARPKIDEKFIAEAKTKFSKKTYNYVQPNWQSRGYNPSPANPAQDYSSGYQLYGSEIPPFLLAQGYVECDLCGCAFPHTLITRLDNTNLCDACVLYYNRGYYP